MGKIVSVVKWIKDNNVATDYTWAKNYTPTAVSTPTSVNALPIPTISYGGYNWTISGGIQYDTANSYSSANGAATTLKSSSQAAAPSSEANHWSFTQGGQSYDSVAVSADAFRSVGAYSAKVTDMSIKTVGGMNLEFSRVYNSLDASNQAGIGNGWQYYPANLTNPEPWYTVTDSPTGGYSGTYPVVLIYQDLDGDYETYTYSTTTHTYQPDRSDYHTKLIRNSDGSYSALRKDQSYYKFSIGLVLLMLKDKNNNGIYYQYDGTTHITRIQDDASHTLTLNYDSQGRVSSVVDWTNRTVSYGYDSAGNLTSVTDPRNNVVHYTYDSSNRLATATDRSNRQIISNTYNDKNKVTSATNGSGLTVNYTYDETNRNVTATDNNGSTTKTYYDSNGRMTEQDDPYNNSTVFTYGTEALPLTVKDKRNNTTTYTYDSSGNVSTVTDANNKQITYTYNSQNLVTQISDARYSPSKTTTFTYDSAGNMLTKTESGVTTTYTYDGSGQQLTVTDPLSHTTSYVRGEFGNETSETSPTNATTSFSYDSLGRLTQQTDPNSHVSSYTYDGNNNVLTATTAAGTVTNVYSPDNKITQSTDQDSKVTSYAYNAGESQTSTTDALTNLTSYGYDQYENLTTQQDALSHTTQYAYDKLNRKTQLTTPLGKVLKWTYDANGNIIKRTDESNRDTTYTYDSLNRLTQITYPDTTTITYTYDDRGNPLTVVGSAGTTTFTYDAFDRVASTTDPHSATVNYGYDNANNLTSVTYPDSKVVNYKYDAANRLKSVSDWNSAKTYYNYNQNNTLQSKQLPNGIFTDYGYDNSSRLSSVQYTQNQNLITKFSYTRDGRGNVTNETESKPSALSTYTIYDDALHSGWSTSWSWNSTVATADTTSPYQGTKDIKWKVNSAWAGLHIRNTGGTISTSGYSALTIAMKASQAGQAVIMNMKDANDNDLSAPIDIGRYGYPVSSGYTVYVIPLAAFNATNTNISALTVEDYSGTSQPNMYIDSIYLTTATATPISMYKDAVAPNFARWSWNDTINESDTSQPFQGTNDLAMTGTSGWSGVQFHDSDGFTTKGYDYLRFALKGSQPNQDYTVQMTNSSGGGLGPELDISKYSGRVDASDYTVYTIPLADVSAANATTYGFILQNQNSTSEPTVLLDNVQLIASPTTNVTTTQSTYTYDSLSRVTSAAVPGHTYSYTYDAAGNRLTSTKDGTQTTSTFNNDNQITAQGSRNFSYDNQGNETADGAKTLTYDFDNRLKTFTSSGNPTVNYVYDATGNRIEKNLTGSTSYQYVNDISGNLSRVLVNKNVTNGTSTYYVYGDGLISQGSTSASTRQYYLDDGLGNVRYTTDNTGGNVQSYTYDPFGNILTGSGTNYNFQAQQQDSEDGLMYLRARYYDPTTGRFIGRDPVIGTLQNPQTQNGYSYSVNNPVNMSDPSGEFSFPTPTLTNPLTGLFHDIAQQFAQQTATDIACRNYVAIALDLSAFIPSGAGERLLGKFGEEIILTQHAATRMTDWGLSAKQVQSAIDNGEKFSYYYQGSWRTGYYDANTKVFVAQAGGNITTVTGNVSPNYINNLKSFKP